MYVYGLLPYAPANMHYFIKLRQLFWQRSMASGYGKTKERCHKVQGLARCAPGKLDVKAHKRLASLQGCGSSNLILCGRQAFITIPACYDEFL